MTRLILEQGGQRRAFKVGDGVLSIGSGAQAALKLQGESVAELHAELVIQGGRVTLRPKPGVLPPKLGARVVTAETAVPPGVQVRIGDATLTVEAPAAGAAATAASAAPPGKREGKAEAPERENWQRSNRELYKSKGLQPKHMLMLLVPVGIVAFFILKKAFEQGPPDAFLAQTQYFHALQMHKAGMLDQATADLDQIPADADMTAELRAQIAQLREEIGEGRRIAALAIENEAGSKYFETQLKQFEQTKLQGKIDRPAARVFLKRLAEFQTRWPRHPQNEWAQRMKDTYGGLVDMTKPPTYADIEYEIKTLTWANPRDYKQCFALLQRFIDGAEADERAKGVALRDTLTKERQEWYDDRTQQAKFEYERNQVGKAVNWLLVLSTYPGDDELEQAAAKRLLDVPRIDEHLRGYRTSRPDWWPQIAANKTIAAWLREHPLD